MDDQPSAPATVTLACVIGALRERVAAWGGRGVLATVLVLLLDRRLGEIGRRIELMLARFRAGRVWRRAAVVPRGAGMRRGATGPLVWPSRFGWLLPVGRYEAGGLSAQLRFVLTQPEMVALLQAAPQARRVLRPLCRALAVETDLLWPGRPPAPPREAVVRVKRVRKPRPKLDLGRIPLPRGVLSAARREGYGKIR